MKYMQAYRYLFESPKWGMNLLWAVVGQFVPVVGPIVFLGYGFDIIESLHRRKDSRYPDFDVNRLGEYLMRGLWVFLVQLVAALPFALIFVCLYACFGIGMAVAPDRSRTALMVVFIPLFVLVVLAASIAVNLVLIPLSLRAGLTQDFGQAFSLDFVKDFIKRVWRETLLLELFLIGTSLVLGLAGLLLCFVGVYPAQALITFAQFHLMYQIYELYLERGGMPIPIKGGPETTPDADVPPAEHPESFRPREDP